MTPDSLWTVQFSGTAAATVTAVGSAGLYLAASLQIALGVDGVPFAQGAFCTASGGSGGGVAPIPNTIATPLNYSPSGLEFLVPGQPRRVSLLYRFKADPGGSGKINYAQLKAVVLKR